MNKLELERKNNRLLYRELFYKANEAIKKQINDIKSISFCQNKKICCKIRYTNLLPAEIYELKTQGDLISAEFMSMFIPYGAGADFDYAVNNNIDIDLNKSLAGAVDKDYIESIIAMTREINYFYYCRNLDAENKCAIDGLPGSLCSNFPNSVTTVLPKECGYREWQKQAIDKLKNQIGKDILNKLSEINNYRNDFNCKKTGTCCRLACSEFGHDELKEKAKNGDNFAQQFTSIFIPYKSIDEARQVFPEYVEIVQKTLAEDEKLYFYHCPHVSDENLCTMYEKRPQICKDFPNSVLAILPCNCGYYDWKEEMNITAMLLLALVEISEFNLKKLDELLL